MPVLRTITLQSIFYTICFYEELVWERHVHAGLRARFGSVSKCLLSAHDEAHKSKRFAL